MRMSLSEILQSQLGCLNGSLILKFHDLIHHLKRPNKKKWYYQPCLCSPKFIQLIWYTLVSAHCKISQIQQVDIQMLLHQLILLVLPIHYQTHLLLRKEGKILVHWLVHYTILINSITHGPWEDLSQVVKKFPMPSWMPNVYYNIHKSPVDAEVLNPLHSVTHLVLRSFVGQFLSWRAFKRCLHIFCLCGLPSTIFLSLATSCIHLLALLSGALCLLNAFQIIPIITIPFSSVDLSCLFNMTPLLVAQYFYCLLRSCTFI